jgi:hypothetical protein
MVRTGGVTTYNPTAGPNLPYLAGGRFALLLRRKSGKYTFFVKEPNGTITAAAESAVLALPALTQLIHGSTFNFTGPLAGIVEQIYYNQGTFSDADITAILEDA